MTAPPDSADNDVVSALYGRRAIGNQHPMTGSTGRSCAPRANDRSRRVIGEMRWAGEHGSSPANRQLSAVKEMRR